MSKTHNKNSPFFSPVWLRILFCLSNLLICCGAVFYKAKNTESSPWAALLIGAVFILGIFAVEILFSAKFTLYLAPAVYGFLFGAVLNVIFQGLINGFQGLNWTFQSPILFSLGMLLFGFLGTLLFASYEKEFNKKFPWPSVVPNNSKIKGNFGYFITALWILTAATAIGLCINLLNILKIFSSMETDNPLRKPLCYILAAFRIFSSVCACPFASFRQTRFVSSFLNPAQNTSISPLNWL